MKKPLTVAAVAEVVTGVALMVVPSLVIKLLFGAEVANIGVVTSRFAGLALIALGVACGPFESASRALYGMLTYSSLATLSLLYLALGGKWNGPLLWPAVVLHGVLTLLLARVWYHSKLLFAALALIPVGLLAQGLAPTPRSSDQAELSKVEEWVLSQGAAESIAPELAAILGLGSERLPVKLKSYRASDGVSIAFAVSTSPSQKGIVISRLKTIADKMKIYSVGTAWLTDRSGTLHRTIAVDASGAQVRPNTSRAAEFNNVKAFFLKKLQDTSPTNTSSPSPRVSATAAGGKKGTK